MQGRVDVAQLYAALDAERRDRGLSWRQVAAEADVSSSLFSRMGKGHRPDLESFASLVQWLGMPAQQFMRRPDDANDVQPALETELTPLLRARKDLTNEDKQYLLDLVNATTKFLKSHRREP